MGPSAPLSELQGGILSLGRDLGLSALLSCRAGSYLWGEIWVFLLLSLSSTLADEPCVFKRFAQKLRALLCDAVALRFRAVLGLLGGFVAAEGRASQHSQTSASVSTGEIC